MKGIFDVTFIETCGCGAQFAVSDTMDALARKLVQDWRQNHNCLLLRQQPLTAPDSACLTLTAPDSS